MLHTHPCSKPLDACGSVCHLESLLAVIVLLVCIACIGASPMQQCLSGATGTSGRDHTHALHVPIIACKFYLRARSLWATGLALDQFFWRMCGKSLSRRIEFFIINMIWATYCAMSMNAGTRIHRRQADQQGCQVQVLPEHFRHACRRRALSRAPRRWCDTSSVAACMQPTSLVVQRCFYALT